MLKESLKKLTSECEKSAIESASEQISRGETTWFVGRPAQVESGCIGLADDDGGTVVIRIEDVVDVIDDSPNFLVEVRSDATILSRTEFASKAGAGDCSCDVDSPDVVPYAINLGNLNIPGLGDLGLNSVVGFNPARDKNCKRKLVKRQKCYTHTLRDGSTKEVCTKPILVERIVCEGFYW